MAQVFKLFRAPRRGWPRRRFNKDGTLAAEAFMKTCFPCHAQAKDNDLVFYALHAVIRKSRTSKAPTPLSSVAAGRSNKCRLLGV
jgi:hypothetical protein